MWMLITLQVETILHALVHKLGSLIFQGFLNSLLWYLPWDTAINQWISKKLLLSHKELWMLVVTKIHEGQNVIPFEQFLSFFQFP